MVMPIGPTRLQCTKCGSKEWIPGYSDAIFSQPCLKCGSTDFDFLHVHMPRSLWPLVRALIEIIPKR